MELKIKYKIICIGILKITKTLCIQWSLLQPYHKLVLHTSKNFIILKLVVWGPESEPLIYIFFLNPPSEQNEGHTTAFKVYVCLSECWSFRFFFLACIFKLKLSVSGLHSPSPPPSPVASQLCKLAKMITMVAMITRPETAKRLEWISEDVNHSGVSGTLFASVF